MYQGKRILAIIPARGGSKGLPGKNIKTLGGIPLIAHSIVQAMKSKYLDVAVVSTNDEIIASLSKEYGLVVPFLRPNKFATDSSPSSDAILHAINWFEKRGMMFDVVLLLEPTSPLRRNNDIDDAIKAFISSYDRADAMVSVGEIHLESPYVAKVVESGYVHPLIRTRAYHQRQQLPKTYFPYGVIYISKVSTYRKTKTFYQTRTVPYFIERWQRYEIDDIYDFISSAAILAYKEQKKKRTRI